MINRLFIILFAITIYITFEGCAPTKPSEQREVLSAERLINKLEANRRKIRTFEGSGSLYVKNSRFENSASFKTILQKPDSIYLGIYGPFGIELAQILVTQNNFLFYETLNNTAYKGNVNEDVLKNIFKVDLSFTQLIDAFTGAVNLTERLYKIPTFFDISQDKYLLTYVDSTKGQLTRYTIDVADLSIIGAKIENLSGTVLFEAQYSDFTIVETVPVPKTIKLRDNVSDQSLDIEYKTINANKKTGGIEFSLPEDVDIISW